MYTAEISGTSPSAFLFIIDQSGSMDERMETEQTKAQFVADVLNKTLYQLVIRCTRADGVRNYFEVGVIAYGDSVRSGFSGAGREDSPSALRYRSQPSPDRGEAEARI